MGINILNSLINTNMPSKVDQKASKQKEFKTWKYMENLVDLQTSIDIYITGRMFLYLLMGFKGINIYIYIHKL